MCPDCNYFICFHLYLLSKLSLDFFFLLISSSSSLVAYNKQFFLHIKQLAASAQLFEDEQLDNYRVIDYRPGKDLQRLAGGYCCVKINSACVPHEEF